MGPLPVYRQAAAVTDALVAPDLDLALDVLGDVATQVALDLQVLVDEATEAGDLLVGEVAHPRVGTDAGGLADLLRRAPADAEDVGEGDLQALLARDVDPCD